jgi:hypothetical protein
MSASFAAVSAGEGGVLRRARRERMRAKAMVMDYCCEDCTGLLYLSVFRDGTRSKTKTRGCSR